MAAGSPDNQDQPDRGAAGRIAGFTPPSLNPFPHLHDIGGGNCLRWLLAFGCLAGAPLLRAQSAGGVAEAAPTGDPPFAPAVKLHGKIASLIQGDAKALPASKKPEPETVSEKSDDNVLVLAPFLVSGRRVPNLSPPVETRLDKFIRTGSLAEHVGRNITTSVEVSRERGLTLNFRF